ncbi:MAG: hypothetical protein MZU97_26100 [Bacillus subtilis]|nr:hypothetical protein [Bacillus subtilis]
MAITTTSATFACSPNFTIHSLSTFTELDFAHLSDVKLSYASHFGGSFQLAKDQEVVLLKDNDTIAFHDDTIQRYSHARTHGRIRLLFDGAVFVWRRHLVQGIDGKNRSCDRIGEATGRIDRQTRSKSSTRKLTCIPATKNKRRCPTSRKNNTVINTCKTPLIT